MKKRRTFLGVVALGVIGVAVWLTIGPSQLGGPVTYVAVTGTSMEPSMHTGDLVVVRKASSYEVGDVVAYQNPQLNSTVIHRIIRKENDGYVFQGDNNDFVDTYRATPEDIVGRRWILIGDAGKIVQLVRSPVGAAVLVMIIAGIVMSGTGKKKRKSGGSPRAAFDSSSTSWLKSNRSTIMTAAGVAAVLFAVLAAFAFMRPSVGTATSKVPYTESGAFSYEASAKKGPVYPSGRLTTGQPIYMQLVDEVKFAFRYSFESTVPHGVSGNGSLIARLSDGNGWTRDFELSPKTSFSGDRWTASGAVELGPIRSLVKKVEQATGVARDFYTLSIVPRVDVDGTMSGHDFSSSFTPNLAMQVGALEIQVAPTTDPSSPDGDALHPSQGGVVLTSSKTAATLGLAGVSLEVAKARWIAIAGFALALTLLGLVGLLVKPRSQDEPAQIEAAYGKLMIPVRSIMLDPAAAQIEVGAVEVLAALARRYDRAILHQQRDDVHRYVLENEGTVYSYECRRLAPLEQPRSANRIEQADLDVPSGRAAG